MWVVCVCVCGRGGGGLGEIERGLERERELIQNHYFETKSL